MCSEIKRCRRERWWQVCDIPGKRCRQEAAFCSACSLPPYPTAPWQAQNKISMVVGKVWWYGEGQVGHCRTGDAGAGSPPLQHLRPLGTLIGGGSASVPIPGGRRVMGSDSLRKRPPTVVAGSQVWCRLLPPSSFSSFLILLPSLRVGMW